MASLTPLFSFQRTAKRYFYPRTFHKFPFFLALTLSISSHSARQTFASATSNFPTHPEEQDAPPQALPAPSASSETQKLDVNSGQTIKLDSLGPIVVNADGSLRRISNWDTMAQIERDNVMRILPKRNQERLARLKEKQDQELQQKPEQSEL